MRKINDGLTNNQRSYRRHREARLRCSKLWREKNQERIRAYDKEWVEQNPVRRKILSKKSAKNRRIRTDSLRGKILQLLGNICSNPDCPISPNKMDPLALQIDHVHGGGNRERESFKRNLQVYYKMILNKIINGSKDYQLLCVYCNWIKGRKRVDR